MGAFGRWPHAAKELGFLRRQSAFSIKLDSEKDSPNHFSFLQLRSCYSVLFSSHFQIHFEEDQAPRLDGCRPDAPRTSRDTNHVEC